MGELCWFLFSGARPGHSSGCWIAPRRQEAIKNGWRVTRSSKHFHLELKKQLLVKETLHLKFSKTFNSLVEGLCLFLEICSQWKPTLGGGFKIWLMCGDWLSNLTSMFQLGDSITKTFEWSSRISLQVGECDPSQWNWNPPSLDDGWRLAPKRSIEWPVGWGVSIGTHCNSQSLPTFKESTMCMGWKLQPKLAFVEASKPAHST